MTDTFPSSFSRRTLLKVGLVGACATFFPESLLAASRGPDPVQAAKRQAEFDAMVPGVAALLSARLGPEQAKACAQDSSARFAVLLPTLPYIGENNRNQENLYQAAWLVAISQAVKARGLVAVDAGRVLYDLCQRDLSARPADELRAQGTAYFTEANFKALGRWAAKTRQRRYPGDWVARVVFGDGQDFDVGHDYSECGAVKLFKAHGQADAAPYFCLNDFTLSRFQGTGLRRVHTLAQGDALCDFRYKRGREVTQCWETEVPRFSGTTTAGKPSERG